MDWNLKFLNLAEHISTWSKDPSTKVGCVIVGPDKEIRSTGYNGFPRGIADDSRLSIREKKYEIICHAEENAIAHAARIGVSLKDCHSYCTWPPCTKCSRLLIQAGISTIIYKKAEIPERWFDDFKCSTELLNEANINIVTI